eukprot:CAMPEP_0113498716 /NCGR_PEP_ID=MMETSP0014_2-20120614/31333_1 /TAXON_ID=2857 /ORGANISM="Nitzschia sp." /LENGTH=191 /DNA_ID=CAMNT_0000392783 /DNA_START=96 /DNA_END=671 /DNA_ORIENTATION=- /assembly_acc=CAM_ASM_000159
MKNSTLPPVVDDIVSTTRMTTIGVEQINSKTLLTSSIRSAASTSTSSTSLSSQSDQVMTETEHEETSSTTGANDEEEDSDHFDAQSLPMPRIDSSSTPFVLEVAPRHFHSTSKDPLQNCVCLYDGSMTTEQVDKYTSSTSLITGPTRSLSGSTRSLSSLNKNSDDDNNMMSTSPSSSSWSFLDMFSNAKSE